MCVELEHTRSWPDALGIAMDHLVEHGRYYDALEVMERELERNPWYRSWWVALPVAAAAVGVGVWLWARNRKVPIGAVPLCAETFDDTGGVIQDVEYLEFRPTGIGQQTALPMIILLVDGDPTGIVAALLDLPVPVRVIVPRPLVEVDDGIERWFASSRTDASSYAQEVSDAAMHLATFVEQVPRCVPTRGLPIIAAYDRGADVAYALAAEVPAAVSAVVGAAGLASSELGTIAAPTTAIHGRDDDVVPYEGAAWSVSQMIGQGAPISWVPMSGVGHSFAGALQVRWLQAVAAAAQAQAAR